MGWQSTGSRLYHIWCLMSLYIDNDNPLALCCRDSVYLATIIVCKHCKDGGLSHTSIAPHAPLHDFSFFCVSCWPCPPHRVRPRGSLAWQSHQPTLSLTCASILQQEHLAGRAPHTSRLPLQGSCLYNDTRSHPPTPVAKRTAQTLSKSINFLHNP